MAKLVLEPGPEPGAPAFRFSQLFPWPAAGSERKGRGRQPSKQQEKTGRKLAGRRSIGEWRGMRGEKKEHGIREGGKREWGGWEVVVEVWKEDSGKVIRFL